MQEQPRRAVPSPISSGNTAPLSLSPKNSSESNTANGTTPVPTSGRTSQMSSPKSPMSPVQEEIQRVRKQIEDMAHELKDAFANEKYDDVRTLGEKKKDLEDKLKSFEEQYSNDKHELQGVKAEIAEVEAEMKAAFESESYTKVSELGKRKQDLKMKLAELESSFGLHNAVYQVGDRVSVVGLTSPRGGNYNGVTGTITEYLSSENRYKVRVGDASGIIAIQPRNLKKAPSVPRGAQSGQSKTRALQGEIKLWFPRKHFGFITPDNKPEGEPDIFFHGTHVENRKAMPIKRFARVRFSVIPAPKGPQARDVTIVGYQPDKEAEAEKQAAMASGSRNSPGSPGRMSSPRRPNNGMPSPRHNNMNAGPRHNQLKPPEMHAHNNMRKQPVRRSQGAGEANTQSQDPLVVIWDPTAGRGDEPNWRRQNARSQEVRSSPTKAKRPPPGFGNKPPGLSPISVSRDMPTVSHSMPSQSTFAKKGGIQANRKSGSRVHANAGKRAGRKAGKQASGRFSAPMAGGLPPISTAMQSLDSDDEFSSHAPHPAPQRPDRQSQRGRSYGSSTGGGHHNGKQHASRNGFHDDINIEDSLEPVSPQAFGFGKHPDEFGGPRKQHLSRLPSCTTDELPSWERNLSPDAAVFEPPDLVRWASIQSNESMDFAANPSPLGAVSARGEPNPNGSKRSSTASSFGGKACRSRTNSVTWALKPKHVNKKAYTTPPRRNQKDKARKKSSSSGKRKDKKLWLQEVRKDKALWLPDPRLTARGRWVLKKSATQTLGSVQTDPSLPGRLPGRRSSRLTRSVSAPSIEKGPPGLTTL